MRYPLNDVVVVLPGITGSVLCDKHGTPIWKCDPVTLAKGVFTGGAAVKQLQLPADVGDGPAPDGVTAPALMPDLHLLGDIWVPTAGYTQLMNWFRTNFETVEADDSEPGRPINLVPFPYDWRLSNRYTARVLMDTIDPILDRYRQQTGRPDAKFVFVAHSMGGLVARYFVDVLGGWERTRSMITLGTPHRGALNALDTLVNGMRPGFGPIRLDLTGVARSLPSLFQLLPEYSCIEGPDKKLLKTTEVSFSGPLTTERVADAMAFHNELRDGMQANGGRYDSLPILADTQPTYTTARMEDSGALTLFRTIEDRDELGDGTVPRLSAAPYGVASTSPILHYVMSQHGYLCADSAAHTELLGYLSGSPVIHKATTTTIGLTTADVLVAGEPLDVLAESSPGVVLQAELTAMDRTPVDFTMLNPSSAAPEATTTIASYSGQFAPPAPGGYYLTVSVAGGAEGDRVTKPIFVAAPDL